MLRLLFTFVLAFTLSIGALAAEKNNVITYRTDTDISYLEKG